AVRRGVRVTADDGHAGEGETLLGADDVNDALTDVVLGVVLDAEVVGVLRKRLDLNAAFLVLDTVLAVRRGRNVVVNDRKRLLRLAHLAARQAEAFEGLRAGHLVDEVAVDVEQAGAVVLTIDNVIVENLVIEGARCGHFASIRRYGSWKRPGVAGKKSKYAQARAPSSAAEMRA